MTQAHTVEATFVATNEHTEHTVVSFVDAGYTRWRCSKCGVKITGAPEEFPGKSACEILKLVLLAPRAL